MKSDNTSKSKKLRIWKEITKLSGKKKKEEHTRTPFELTSLLHCRNRASHVKHATEQKNVPSEGGEESARNKNTSICFVQKNLSCSASSVRSLL